MIKDDNNDLEWFEYTLLEILRAHRGREQAIHKRQLLRAFKKEIVGGERGLRKAIKHLVIKHGYPIGSCPDGYFWAVTPKEIEDVVGYYRSYGLSCLRVAARLQKIPLKIMLGQLTFDAMFGKGRGEE
jgi:hypothetical protein